MSLSLSQAGTSVTEERQPARRGRKPNYIKEREREQQAQLALLAQQAQRHGGGSEDAPESRPSKRERVDAPLKERKERQRLQRKNLFAKDREWTGHNLLLISLKSGKRAVPSMLYAYGDDPEPLPESIAVLEEIMVDYLTDLVR